MKRISQYLRCVVAYKEINHVRVLHYAVNADCVDSFVSMIYDTFVGPDFCFTDIFYSYDNREFFNLI